MYNCKTDLATIIVESFEINENNRHCLNENKICIILVHDIFLRTRLTFTLIYSRENR